LDQGESQRGEESGPRGENPKFTQAIFSRPKLVLEVEKPTKANPESVIHSTEAGGKVVPMGKIHMKE
jgi:hypothetical protein